MVFPICNFHIEFSEFVAFPHQICLFIRYVHTTTIEFTTLYCSSYWPCMCEFWGFHGCEDIFRGLLGCEAG